MKARLKSLPQRPMTNEEKVVHMMNHSNYGALRQVFIMEAIRKYAEQVAAADPKIFEGMALISGTAWQGCARETLKDLATEMKVADEEDY